MPVLICSKSIFYSQLDEEMFFDALTRISSVKKVKGVGDDVCLSVTSRISDKTLRDLLGLFYRYDADMRQLTAFITDKNRSWFCDTEAYWFKRVFPQR